MKPCGLYNRLKIINIQRLSNNLEAKRRAKKGQFENVLRKYEEGRSKRSSEKKWSIYEKTVLFRASVNFKIQEIAKLRLAEFESKTTTQLVR